MRRRLVDVLRQKGICAADVLDAIGRVPRHRFIDDSAFLRMAYEDVPFPIGHGQTISQPYTVARQTELLRPAHGLKVLEIGTGCGYQTAVLCELGLKVHSIERVRPLHVQTKTRLSAMGYRPHLVYGDGFKGLPSYAPFDRILVTCGAPEVPAQLMAQLKAGGTMVVPVGAGEVQTMLVMEVEPAAYITLAANEAEKAAPVYLNHMSSVGVYGRMWLSGTESSIEAARAAAITAIEAVTGK